MCKSAGRRPLLDRPLATGLHHQARSPPFVDLLGQVPTSAEAVPWLAATMSAVCGPRLRPAKLPHRCSLRRTHHLLCCSLPRSRWGGTCHRHSLCAAGRYEAAARAYAEHSAWAAYMENQERLAHAACAGLASRVVCGIRSTANLEGTSMPCIRTWRPSV